MVWGRGCECWTALQVFQLPIGLSPGLRQSPEVINSTERVRWVVAGGDPVDVDVYTALALGPKQAPVSR